MTTFMKSKIRKKIPVWCWNYVEHRLLSYQQLGSLLMKNVEVRQWHYGNLIALVYVWSVHWSLHNKQNISRVTYCQWSILIVGQFITFSFPIHSFYPPPTPCPYITDQLLSRHWKLAENRPSCLSVFILSPSCRDIFIIQEGFVLYR